jgi:hypothetical protein
METFCTVFLIGKLMRGLAHKITLTLLISVTTLDTQNNTDTASKCPKRSHQLIFEEDCNKRFHQLINGEECTKPSYQLINEEKCTKRPINLSTKKTALKVPINLSTKKTALRFPSVYQNNSDTASKY